MKLLDDILYLHFSDLTQAGVSEHTIKSARNRNSPSWSFISDPHDRRYVLIEYEKLRDTYKDKVKEKFGDPYDYVVQQPIKNMVQWDHEAERFYLDYRYNNNKDSLTPEHVNKYTKAASWLNMLIEVDSDKRILKKQLNIKMDQFYSHVVALLKIEKVALPKSYRRLRSRINEYKKGSYKTLIDPRHGNKSAAKVKDELAESILLDMLEHPNQYDDVFIWICYNEWAKKNKYKEISKGTVGEYRRKYEHILLMKREGNAAWKDKYSKQAKGYRPTQPLYLVESDDNHLDLLFLDPNDKSGSKYYHKYKAIVVVDSYNDYPLGYAYAENLSLELVKAAYLNAMYHLRSLTGGWYLPHETKTDRWGLKALRPFYKSLGKYEDTPVGSKGRGYIEQVFGTAHWKRCLKAGAINYSGNNLTARNRGVNTEVLNLNKKNYPLVGNEAIEQIEQFFHRLRHMPQSTGVSKQDQWLEGWNNIPAEKKREISDEQFLLKFGIEHNYRGEGIRITNRGVEPQINKTKYSYDLEEYRLDWINKKVSVLYDPFDMSRVLVTDHKKIRTIARDARLNPRAMEDAHTDSRVYLNSIFNEKKEQVEQVAAASDRRKQVLNDHHVNAEAVLQSGMVTKEIKQMAEQRILLDNSDDQEKDFNPFDQI